jgi:tRNA pseudouridine38-40 synthase
MTGASGSTDRRAAGASKNIMLTLEYEGTNYHGWQSQAGSGQATVQETVEKALSTLSGEPVKVNGSSRTDAGVHALAYVCNMVTCSSIPPAAWAPAMNHFLPEDIRALASEEAAPDFHARFSSIGKIYSYRILNRRAPSALYRHAAWHVNRPLNIPAMESAAKHLTGQHDFSAFRAAGCSASSPIRTLRPIRITKSDDTLEIRLEADSFLQYMVRNIAGTLVEVGLGRFRPEEVKQMLQSCDRTTAGRTAPAHGLYLVRVLYGLIEHRAIFAPL